MFKKIFRRVLGKSGIYPGIFFHASALKLFEFNELLKEVEIKKTDIILDAGCGKGLQTFVIGKKCNQIIGIDVSEKSIAEANRTKLDVIGNRTEFFCMDTEKTKFSNNYFDKIISICVLEHINNYPMVLQEWYRVLKKGGQLIFSVDSLETIRDKNLKYKHHKEHRVQNYFRSAELKTEMQKIGFTEVMINPIFQSNFANKLFVKGIKNNFRFNFIDLFHYYPILKIAEKNQKNKNGIILIAKCKK
jgi:ubiquinone/menaquinone biosynthesis C-methylase UbiE